MKPSVLLISELGWFKQIIVDYGSDSAEITFRTYLEDGD